MSSYSKSEEVWSIGSIDGQGRVIVHLNDVIASVTATLSFLEEDKEVVKLAQSIRKLTMEDKVEEEMDTTDSTIVLDRELVEKQYIQLLLCQSTVHHLVATSSSILCWAFQQQVTEKDNSMLIYNEVTRIYSLSCALDHHLKAIL